MPCRGGVLLRCRSQRVGDALQVTLYGLRLMEFNAAVKIQRILAFRQLTPAEQEEFVKPELRQAK